MTEGRAPAWLALFAALPADARPVRKPVAPPGSEGAAPDSPIAGWESLTLDLSAPLFGTRIVLVTLDATGAPISGSDHVMTRLVSEGSDDPLRPSQIRQLSLGGRIEPDGTFRGTYWTVEGVEPEGEEDPNWTYASRPPTDEEVGLLLGLVKDVMARSLRVAQVSSSGP